MRYTRLIAFGCSLTYGHGLRDCSGIGSKDCGTQPSKLGWPNRLANSLDIPDVVNQALPGCSNKYIWQKIVDFKFQPNDIVFIAWTFIDRSCMWSECNKHFPIGNWQNDPKSKAYYRYFYSEHDSNIDSNLRIHHANTILRSKDIKVYNIYADDRSRSEQLGWNDVVPLAVEFLSICAEFPKALDGSHPGEEAHAHIANTIYSQIKGTH